MRPLTAAVLIVGILSAIGCTEWPRGPVYPETCGSKPHFQIVAAEVLAWKSGYPGQEKNMNYPALSDKTVIKLDTCSGQAWYLRQVDEKGTALKTAWFPIVEL